MGHLKVCCVCVGDGVGGTGDAGGGDVGEDSTPCEAHGRTTGWHSSGCGLRMAAHEALKHGIKYAGWS